MLKKKTVRGYSKGVGEFQMGSKILLAQYKKTFFFNFVWGGEYSKGGRSKWVRSILVQFEIKKKKIFFFFNFGVGGRYTDT